MKIAILGTRGIPNNYGGFEQFAQYISLGLVKKGHEITVYSPHNHIFQDELFRGVNIQHIFDPEYIIGTTGQFIYDFLSIRDTKKKNFDIIFQLGYTSSSIFFPLHPKHSIIITNMDGLEWKRTKYSKYIQKFLKWAESLAVKDSDSLVSDSIGIKNYLKNKYNKESTYIPYGASVFTNEDNSILSQYNLKEYKYNMLIARLEPENSIEIILDGTSNSKIIKPFLVIGNNQTKYGEYLKKKYKKYTNIIFMGSIYDMNLLNNLRFFSNVYFHGHTVGGTNPSLLEAMGSSSFICANKNEFNVAILEDDAIYFKNTEDVKNILDTNDFKFRELKIKNNLNKIKEIYSWEKIINDYESLFFSLLRQ